MKPRRATADDLDTVVETLVSSHLDYVWERWAVRGERRQEQLTELVRHHVELVALPDREVWMHDDGSGVAIWRDEPAGPLRDDVAARMAEVSAAVFGDRLPVIEAVDARVFEHRPEEPHCFLGTMGVRPEVQRRGLGTALLLPMLAELDRHGTPACLETSSTGNVEFYRRLGFTVLAHLDDLPGGAPETWVLWRAPNPENAG